MNIMPDIDPAGKLIWFLVISAASMLTCGLTGPLSAVLGPITTVAGAEALLLGPPAAAARMFQWAQKLRGPVDYHPGSP